MNMIRLGALAFAVLIGIVYFLSGITSVNPGEYAILMKQLGSDKGMQDTGLAPGTHWVDPMVYDVIIYDTRSQQYTDGLEDVPSQTNDGQPILVDISLEIGLNADHVPALHQDVGPDWFTRVVYPAARSSIRNSTSALASDKIYTGQGRQEVQASIQKDLVGKYKELGISIIVNLRDITFENKQYVAKLEEKSIASQAEEINRRQAKAAEQDAIRVANVAEGEKQKRIKAAEAEKEEARLSGEGLRLKQEEEAKGILAMETAKAAGQRMRREALSGPGGAEMVSMEWARQMGPNVKVYGFPTGAPGTTSIMDVNSVIQGAFKSAGGQ